MICLYRNFCFIRVSGPLFIADKLKSKWKFYEEKITLIEIRIFRTSISFYVKVISSTVASCFAGSESWKHKIGMASDDITFISNFVNIFNLV